MCYTCGYNLIQKNLTAATWPFLLILSQSMENLEAIYFMVGNKRQGCSLVFLVYVMEHPSEL